MSDREGTERGLDGDATALALVGAVGGAGATRLTVEAGAALAHEGRDVALLDAAYATQGLADHCPGRIDPDVTACVTEERPLDEGLVTLPFDTDGRVACLPAYAPFERLARAKAPEAAGRLEGLVERATDRFDAVLVDTPPVAANQAVAAVTTGDRVVLVTPDSRRGADALPRAADRLRDIGVVPDCEVANAGPGGTEGTVQRADVTVPPSEATSPDAAPAYGDDAAFTSAVASVLERTLDIVPDPDDGGGLGEYVPGLSG
ncbi:ParA family protein [Haloglomus litoreum]|uniref:ParA family protein n=1 Tax=Haloglomus litoreum TaxID=3034026 RepID=UPI0023E7B07D|nr:ParA family protein [Haloglomus sp. DT116]